MPIATEAPPMSERVRVLIPDNEEVILTIVEAKIDIDQYSKPDANGKQRDELVITWELQAHNVTKKLKKLGVEPGMRLWQHLWLEYYDRYDGLPTPFKATMDALNGRTNDVGVVFAFSIDTFEDDIDQLEGIEAPCMIAKYAKKKGKDIGKLANRITAVRPPDDEDDEDETPTAPAAPPVRRAAPPARPAPRNVPQPDASGGVDDALFPEDD